MSSIIALPLSIISGVMACLLFFLVLLTERKKRSIALAVWACLFLAASFAGLEWLFWLEGYNIFDFIFGINGPLIFFFVVWVAFVIWLFEEKKRRKVWIILLIITAIWILVSVNCMSCLRV